ncbi:MAG: Holliday junction resolvase RuvX [Patescibacteria group bacterium]
MRYLGIDYGDKRVGLALSDEDGILGMPFKTIQNQNLIKVLKKIIKDENVGMVIVGLPLNLNMQETGQTKKVNIFRDNLKRQINIPVEFENEFLTSVQAEKSGVGKDKIDEASAALILQSYFDKMKAK